MKLTKSDREAFVRAVIDDVPTVDYQEQAETLVRSVALSTFPEDLRPMVTKYPDYFEDHYVWLPGQLQNRYFKIDKSCAYELFKGKFPEIWKQLSALAKQLEEQNERVRTLRQQLSGVIESCSTLKQAKERLPEFEKYLPQERNGVAVANLPAISNLVTDLMAAGWPKSKGGAA